MLDLFRWGLSLGRRFGNRVSVKLCKWFEIGNHGAWLPTEPPPKTKRNSNFGHAEVAANDVVGQVEVRDSRVLDRGPMMDLIAPNPMSRSFAQSRFLLRMLKQVSWGEREDWKTTTRERRTTSYLWAFSLMGLLQDHLDLGLGKSPVI